ncbi:MAG: hydrogenase nickel incorporation protein HypB [Candidatus Nanopelagicales bacterium]|nr:hydrogenase nickel incorporation protein HypB [Candidatus Nanopelagicales bacterium]
MHELSIAHAVVSTVREALPDPQARVTQVRLRIGVLSGVVAQALHFAYDVATDGTALAGSTLEILEMPVVINCPTDGAQTLGGIRDFTCPVCGQPCGDVIGGKELEVADVTFDEQTGIEELREGVLAKNDLLADGLRGWFTVNNVNVSNWVSSPGSGKTALLEVLLAAAVERGLGAAALVGDCATDNDATRLARSGAQVRQIITDGMCHLESDMVSAHLQGWEMADLDLLVIENVGNLVCPTGYDLGEDTRVALLSVTEGEDKPLKYPQIFHSADVVVVTKTDIAEAVEWDRDRGLDAIRQIAPEATIIETSARTGVGVQALLDLLLDSGDSRIRPSTQLQEAT